MLGFHDQSYFLHKNKNNTEEAPFGIPEASTEKENNLMFNTIGNREICLCWKYTGTLGTQMIQYYNQSVTA